MKTNLRYNNLTSPKQGRPGMSHCRRALTILCLTLANVGAWAADYVFMNGNYFLGQTTAATTDFVPNASIYTGNSGGTFLNKNNYYIRYNNGLAFSTTNSTNLNIANNQLYYSTGGLFATYNYLNLNGTTWRMTNNNNRATAYTVTKNTIAAGVSDFTIAGNSYISSTGGFNYSHTNAINNQACNVYTFNDRTYYSTNDAQAASTTQPSTEITTGYVWSLTGNGSYATVNTTNGRITVNSLPTEDVEMTLTCTLNGTKTASMKVTLTKNPPVDAGYVFYSGGNNGEYLANAAAGQSNFDPSTCIWNGISGGTFTNGTYYLRRNTTFLSNQNNASNCTLGGTESGETGRTIQLGTGNTTYYLTYSDGSFSRGTTASTIVFSVTKKTSSGTDNTTAPTISAAINSTNNGVQLLHTNVTGTYSPAYEDYIFYNNTHHYWYDGSIHDQKPADINFASTTATYTWSIASGDQYATIDASGNLKSKGVATTEQTVRVKLTTTHAASGYSNEQTYDVKIQDYAATNVTASIGDNHVINNVGGTLTMRGSLTGNYTPAYTKYTVGYTSHNLYNGTDYGYNVPAINGGTGCVYTWSLSGEGKDYSSLNSTTGQQPILSYNTDAGHDVVVTLNLKVTHPDFPDFSANADTWDVTLYSASIAAPVITYDEGTNKVTLSVPSEGTTYYTTDGSDPKTSGTKQEYTAPFTITRSPTTVKAYSERWGVQSEVETQVIKLKLGKPTITVNDNGVATITLEGAPAGTQFRYTTDGSDPTETSSLYDAANKPVLSNGNTIKAIAVKDGYTSSDVAEESYSISSGVRDGKVILNDYEDHNWTYYAGVDPEVDGGNYNTNYKGKLYSPNPRNVKITYKANGGAVSIDESETEFVYYKTLEESATAGEYQYQVISNPFSKRPNGKGFGGWKITKGSDYIKNKNTNATLALDEEIVFENLPYPSVNCTSAEIELTATWVNANIQYGGGNINATAFSDGNYETNLLVINANYSNALAPTYPVTIMMVEPDGSADYRGRTLSSSITPVTGAANTTKIEFANWTNTGDINAQGRNLTIGRGVTHSGGTLYGTNTNANINQVFKIESGSYQDFYAIGDSGPTDNMTKQHIIFGNDYDRANNNDNSKMKITKNMYMLGKGANTGTNRLIMTAKSGSFTPSLTHTTAGASGNCFYLSYNSGTTRTNHRTLIIEGGEFWHIAGGYDNYTSTDVNLKLRVKGGIIHGCIYGGAAQYPAGGSKQFVFTGGTVEGWIAGGANGYLSSQAGRGQTNGYSYVYVGGNTVVDSDGDNTGVDNALGGNVYGAGCGNADLASAGRIVNGSNVVLADNAFVERGVYGGGAYGESQATANVYVTGGHVASGYDTKYNVFGGVYGGARQKGGGSVNVYMTGGQIDGKTHNTDNGGGLFGGSNYSGTIANNVTMRIDGGQVGTSTKIANIHGGGYGQNTQVTQNVDITLGKAGAARDADGVTVWGDIYGGSALGSVNGTAATNTYHTNVTMNAGYIHGSLYGGALGQKNGVNGATSDIAANVYGPVAVTVNGGSVMNTDGSGANGSGAVYGANNINGAPQRSVTVDIYGTNSAPAEGEYALFSVYGGGNQANYTYGNGYPKVTVHNCDNSIEYVYGGGNAAAVAATDVTIYGGDKIGNVFGGGNGQVRAADVTGGTNVKIYGGTIGDVYGGSNTDGNITGTINVNVNAQAEPDHAACPIDIDNVYGGGNKAASAAGNVTIGCAEHIGAVYGGANQANINGNINLSIVSGHIDNVFGGNNTSGSISGTITVTVNDNNSSCGMEVGNVYGGGNQAAYSIYGYNNDAEKTPKTSGIAVYDNPIVNIENGHLSGSVFGGGLGTTAVMYGSPAVTIGDDNGSHTVTIDGNVFGGGDAANLQGKPVVVVQNCNTVIGTQKDGEGNNVDGTVYGGGNAAHIVGDGNGTDVTIQGGTIYRAFAGGNGEVSPANVAGDAQIVVHGGLIGQLFAGSNMQGEVGGSTSATIDHENTACNEKVQEVYGGGNMAAGSAGIVTIECGAIVGDVYGGANQANISNDITLNITGGTIDRAFGGNNTSGNISGTITVNVNKDPGCDLTLGSVFGAGNQAAYTGHPTVNIKNGTVTNNVFGGGLGATAIVTGNPQVTIGDNTDAAWIAAVGGDVYGGGDAAAVEGTPVVHVIAKANTTIGSVYGGGNAADVNGTNVTVDGGTITGMVFGGGHGDKDAEPQKEANVNGYVNLSITGGTINKVFAGSNSKGNITGEVNFTINKGNNSNPMHINEVYGGGNEAAGNAGTINIICTGGAEEGIKDVYGGANAADINSNIALNISGGNIQNVFGGNNTSGNIKGSIAVTVNQDGSCGVNHIDNVYGGGNKAYYSVYGYNDDGTAKTSGDAVYAQPTVKILNGTISENVYGGGLGNTAIMYGNPVVTIGDADDLNNDDVQAIVTGDVYGGGDAAAVVGVPVVNVINKCNTQIANVYGGGNAADVSGTDVNIDGGTITGMVFGGGHGDLTSEPQKEANVGGDVHVDITGGTIGKVFGGSNSKGNITGDIYVNIDYVEGHCAMNITEVYGGGNFAEGNAGQISIGCTGTGTIANVFGGANNADINNDIVLNITGGKITNVFGGNNNGGYVKGGITVNINEDGEGCGLQLANVFGGGNLAQYTIPSEKYLTVNIKNGTISQNVYGGGKGDPADHTKGQITGNPVVNIGDNTDADWVAHVVGDVYGGGDAGNVVGTPQVNIINKCNTIIDHDVYGGGNAADVSGTDVNIDGGTITGMVFGGGHGDLTSEPQKEANVGGDVHVDITGGSIGKVFGGSNSKGNITGTINLNINKEDGHCDMHITEVYGGGNQADGNAGTVTINCTGGIDEGIQNVYGGARNADVDNDIVLTIKGGTYSNVFGGNNVGGNITGSITVNIEENDCTPIHINNLYGGGNLAAYSGTPSVNVLSWTSIANVFGGGYGSSAAVGGSDVKVNPTLPKVVEGAPDHHSGAIGSIFGGGNAAPVKGNTSVLVKGGTAAGQKVTVGGDYEYPAGHAPVLNGYIFGGGNQAPVNKVGGTKGNTVVTVTGNTEVTNNVYGGGNGGEVMGDTKVIIGE